MTLKNPNLCKICGDNRSHNGNKKLAALHSRMTQQKLESGEIKNEREPKRLPVYSSDYYWSNGQKVGI